MERRLIVAVPDLIFQSRIEAAAVARGLVVVAAASDQEAEEAIGRGAAGLVVDLQAAGFAPGRVLEAARAARVPALAFGRHTDAAALRAAREAGATAVPRSQLAEELGELLGKLVGDADAAASGA